MSKRDSSGLYGLLRDRLDAFTHDLEHLHTGDVEALHRTRVASRRLRELLLLVKMDHGTSRKLSRRLKKVTRQLGRVREIEVLMLSVEELSQDRRFSPVALAHLGRGAAAARSAARERLAAKLPTAKLERLARRLDEVARQMNLTDNRGRRLSAAGPPRAWLWAAQARTARRATRVRSAVEDVGAVYVPAQLHRVRIALKKLRYSAELLPEAQRYPSATADIAALKSAQELLGGLHDLAVLVERARQEQASLSPPDLMTWHQLGALVHAVEDRCRALHARYMHDRRKLIAIADRFGGVETQAASVNRRAGR